MTDQINELCHHLLNGITVVKSLCAQGRSGALSPEETWSKIEHRCRGLEQAFRAIKERRELSTRLRQGYGGQADTDGHENAGTPFDRIKEQRSEV
jgi:hypothetical protein